MVHRRQRERSHTRTIPPGMGRIFRRGQIYWVAYYRSGREHLESHALDGREPGGEAPEESVRRNRQSEIRRTAGRTGDVRGPAERHRARLQGSRPPLDASGGRTHAASEESIQRQACPRHHPRSNPGVSSSRLDEKASPATINRETSHLARTFRIAVKSGVISVLPTFPIASRKAHVRRRSHYTL